MGLNFRVSVRWFNLFLDTPRYHDLNHALKAWTQMNTVLCKIFGLSRFKRKQWRNVLILHGEWPKLRAAYIDIVSESAVTTRERCASRFDHIWAASAVAREKKLEWCNRMAMLAEVRYQQRLA